MSAPFFPSGSHGPNAAHEAMRRRQMRWAGWIAGGALLALVLLVVAAVKWWPW